MTLPFPFDAVENFFKDLFNQIYSVLISLPGRLISSINSIAQVVQNALGPILDNLSKSIFSQLGYIKDQILGVFAGVPQAINTLTGGLMAALQPFFKNIYDSIVNFTSTIYGRISGFIGPAFTTLQQFFNSAFNSLSSGVSSLTSIVSKVITPALQAVGATLQQIPGFISQQGQALQQNVNNFANSVKQDFGGFISYVSQNFNAFSKMMNDFGGQIRGATIALTDIVPSLDRLGAQIWQQGSKIFKDAYDATLKPIFDSIFNLAADFGKRLQDLFKPNSPLTPETAIAICGTLGAASTTILATRWGINTLGKVLTIGQVSALQHDFTELLTSIGVIAAGEKFNTAPIEFGIMPIIERGWKKILRPAIPSVNEILDAASNGYFDGQNIEIAPENVRNLLSQHGLSDDLQNLLWSIHFSPLDINQMAQAYHRGLIDRKAYDDRFGLLAYKPSDLELFFNLSYSYPGPRQARVLTQLGLLDNKLIDKIVSAAAIHPDFVPAYTTMLQEGNIIPLYNKIEAVALQGFKDDVLNEGDLTNMLKQIKKPDNIISSELTLARLERDLDFKKFQITTIEQAMKRGVLSLEDGNRELVKIGLGPDRISIIIARAQYEQKIKTSAKAKDKTKDLSVAQIIKAVSSNLIPLEDGFNAVQAQGYDANETKVLFELALGKTQ